MKKASTIHCGRDRKIKEWLRKKKPVEKKGLEFFVEQPIEEMKMKLRNKQGIVEEQEVLLPGQNNNHKT